MNVSDVNACPNRRNAWSDCGKGGISEQECLAKGCCWDPKSEAAWCYHRGRLEVPKLSWFYKIWDVLRATWANNHGDILNEHPSMSEWYEWPLMLHRSVPFGETETGGRLKAFGNPGIYYPVALVVFGSTLALLVWAARSAVAAAKLILTPPALTASPYAAVDSYFLTNERRIRQMATAQNAIGGGGFINPFITLLLGYYLNLVPYQLIERCKFAYHYIPALIVGMMFTAFVADTVLRVADLPLSGRSAWVVNRKLLARGIVCFLYVCACAGFYYWALPYALGIPLSVEEHRARMWVRSWANEDAWIFPPEGIDGESYMAEPEWEYGDAL
jgi:dolichyl-phosphate-mannose--protein O-mannosyl transferase